MAGRPVRGWSSHPAAREARIGALDARIQRIGTRAACRARISESEHSDNQRGVARMPANLSIKNVPEEVITGLRNRAVSNQRSLNAELLEILKQAAKGQPRSASTPCWSAPRERSPPWMRRPPGCWPPATASTKRPSGVLRICWADPITPAPATRTTTEASGQARTYGLFDRPVTRRLSQDASNSTSSRPLSTRTG